MQPVSFVICNYNAPEYCRFCYESLRRNLSPEHEIVLLDDGSTDDESLAFLRGLDEQADPNLVRLENGENIGIAYSYNRAVEAAKHEFVCVLHSDMYVPPGFDEAMVRAMEADGGRDFVAGYRAEPALYPPSADKTVADFGNSPERFDEAGFLAWNEANAAKHAGASQPALFFPWMVRRSFYAELGGTDLLFLKYMVDDDDLYLRVVLSGARWAQALDAAVYHFGSRSTRFAAGTTKTAPSPEWAAQYARSRRNFTRKWGTGPDQCWTADMRPVPPKVFDIGILAPGAGLDALRDLEPLAANVYVDDAAVRKAYLAAEGGQTMLNLAERVRLASRGEPENHVVASVSEGALHGNQREATLNGLRALPRVLAAMAERTPPLALPFVFEPCAGVRVEVRSLESRERDLIRNTRCFAHARGMAERPFTS